MSLPSPLLPIILLILAFSSSLASATEFIFNTNFSSTNILLFSNASVQSSILTLTTNTPFSVGRAFYPFRIRTKNGNSSTPQPFSTSFIFSIAPYENVLPGHGFAFLFSPFAGSIGASTSAQNLGLFNFTNNGDPNNHVFAVEFDVFRNQEFSDINDNHVGVDLNSLTSIASYTAGFWDGNGIFRELKLNNGVNYQVWIEFVDSVINVTMALVGAKRPRRPLISQFLNLSEVFLDETYVGFTGATGQLVQSHRILAWSFSTTNFSISDALVTADLPSFVLSDGSIFKSTAFAVGISVGTVFIIGSGILAYVIYIRRKRKRGKGWSDGIDDWELEYWPHRFDYKEIYGATKGFSDTNLIGIGGNGKVYKGVLPGGIEVAVKRTSLENGHGMREFLSEVSSLGRLKHRNLVGLRGWCKNERGTLILVYDFMENGSVDKRLFECDENVMLSWEERMKVLKDVASGILYLHEGWDTKVLHRDIKASNVLLDKDMNARLGDFGLARMHHHGQLARTTLVVGTVGYMAPEVVRTGRSSAEADVFGFGVMILEVVSGRRPIEEGKPSLVDWVWSAMEREELVFVLDERVKAKGEGGYSIEEVETLLRLGLLCTYPDPSRRPTMRQVVKVLEGSSEGTESTIINERLGNMLGTKAMRSNYCSIIHGSSHPTFQEIRESISLTTLFDSDIIKDGR